MGRVLIVDDDKVLTKAMSILVKRSGHVVAFEHTLQDGLRRAAQEEFDVVFLDVMLPDGNGLSSVSRFRAIPSEPEVIIITADADADGAELAIKSGAWDYYQKKSSLKDMLLPLTRAIQYRREKLSNRVPLVLNRGQIIGDSPRMKASIELLAQAACSDASVLIIGETGTGKELFARAIHANSKRQAMRREHTNSLPGAIEADSNFVVLDCTALPETLVESVLFGHIKGAFTGADQAREGLIKQTDGGTLFLDEVGELPLETQKTFLRVLQERRFRPIGSKQELESNFRLIAATNRDLDQMAEEGSFRKDLLFRMRSLVIEIPPLRERKEDIRDLVNFHVKRLCCRYGIELKQASEDFYGPLESYRWPGNVRELVNTIDGAIALAGQELTLFSKHLPMQLRVKLARNSFAAHGETSAPLSAVSGPDGNLPKLKEFRQLQEQRYLKDLIAHSQRDIKKACRLSGLSRSRLYDLLSKYNLSLANR